MVARKRPSAGSTATRDLNNLYTSPQTLDCVRSNHCIACAYKIGCFDVALDNDLTSQCPNQRPEQCPRTAQGNQALEGVLGYTSKLRYLTIGDGDLTFSLGLARLNPGATIVATSYESQETLLKVYPNIQETIQELRQRSVLIRFQVDATRLKETLGGKAQKYDRIHWNFPCTAISKGQDGQNKQMEENKQLVRSFVAGCRAFLSDTGQIHMIHKTKPPYNQWLLEVVAIDNCRDEIAFLGRIVFDRCLFPPYIPRKALDRKSFPHHDACIYMFGWKGQELLNCIPVTEEVILDVRSTLLRNKKTKRRRK